MRRTTKNISEQNIGVRKADGDSSPSLQKDQNDTNMLINDLSFAIRPFYDMIIARPLCLLEAFSRSVIKGQVARRVGLGPPFRLPSAYALPGLCRRPGFFLFVVWLLSGAGAWGVGGDAAFAPSSYLG